MAKKVLGFDNAAHHTEWYNTLDNKNIKRMVIAAPRSHAKSTCFSVNFSLQEIARDRNIRILIVSNSAAQSQMFLREIKGRITRDQNYIEYAGDLMEKYPEKWTTNEIVIARDNIELKDPTISTVGAGGTILARRADLIIADDLLDPDNTRTADQREKIKQWFYEVLMPVLEPNGRIIYVGTVWHPDDLLCDLLESPAFEYRKKYKAIISDSKRADLWDKWVGILQRDQDVNQDQKDAKDFLEQNKKEMYRGVKVLWPERMPYETLYLLRKDNSFAFAKSYQNEALSSEDQKFKNDWIDKAREMGKGYRLVKILDDHSNFIGITQGLDLAISQKAGSSETALVTLGQFNDGQIIVLNIERGQFTPAQTRQVVSEQNESFSPLQIKVENVAYQESMRKDLAEMNLPVKGYGTGSEKFNEELGIDILATLMENERLILPYDKSDSRTVRLIDQLCDEMRQWPTGHTGDSLMALWFAYTAVREIIGKQRVTVF